MKTYDLPKGSNNTIVDALYVPSTKYAVFGLLMHPLTFLDREFLVALSGNSIVNVTDVQTTIPLAAALWPCSPRKMHLHRDKLVVVMSDGTVGVTDTSASPPASFVAS